MYRRERQALAGESSTMTTMRKRRPSANASERKSRLQSWLARCALASGAVVPSARLRPLRRCSALAPGNRMLLLSETMCAWEQLLMGGVVE
jgi:hypothetical protein